MTPFNTRTKMSRLLRLLLAWSVTCGAQAYAQTITDHTFKTSDGVRLHYLEAGSGPRTLVFIPGWIMPAAVFEKQLATLSSQFRVLAFDPRSQGQSEISRREHNPKLRMQDMHEFLAAAHVQDFILAGWSLGVLESLDYVARYQPKHLKGLILIDNSIGMAKPPGSGGPSNFQEIMNDPVRREAYLRKFSKDLFRRPAPPEMSEAIVESALRVPPKAAIQLINQPYPRTYWRETVEAQNIPVMYVVTPRLKAQAQELQSKKQAELATVMVFTDAGHALFVDQAEKFNTAVLHFSQAAFKRGAAH
jgi:microsomal epoxide hydrolase